MSRSPQDDDFFIGWAATPAADRRFFLRAGLVLTAACAGLGFGLASLQRSPGPGDTDPDSVREWRGVIGANPYAALRTRDLDGEVRTALLACEGKCGVAARVGALAGAHVVVTGSLIQRGRHAMIAVDQVGDWVRRDPAAVPDAMLAFPSPESLGEFELAGEILDSKCWFGAMRPASGKTHKACASLCIRGGIPPAFFAGGPGGSGVLTLLVNDGRAFGPELLEYVADPVRVRGRLFRLGDLDFLDLPMSAIRRV